MSTTPQYSQEIINIGAAPNDQQGDPLRVAFSKINNNFSTLFQTFVNSTISYTFGNVPGQVIFETPVSTFTEGQFYIKSYNDGTPDSQTIQLYAQVNDGGNAVKFTGYGSTFFGNSVSLYDMIVDSGSGNVQILSNPLLSADLTHFISSQIMWVGPNVPGAYISTEDSLNSSLATETVVDITTEQP
jgi:hypothetical protein